MTKHLSTLLFLGALVTLVAGLFPFIAMAAGKPVDNVGCYLGDGTLNNVFCSLTNQFKSSPKLLSMFSWAGAVIMAIIGLINLKEYGDDPSSVPMRNIIVKFVVALLLVTLPLIMSVFISTVTGESNSGGSMVSTTSGKMRLGSGQIGGK